MTNQYVGNSYWENFLINYVLADPEERPKLIKKAMENYKLSLRELSTRSGIPESTIYKIASQKSNVTISNLHRIINVFRSFETVKNKEPTIAVITARYALQEVSSYVNLDDFKYKIAEYPATTIEEEIIQGIKAQSDGCIAIICGPVAANTLNKVVKIPVMGLSFSKDQLEKAIEKVAQKIPRSI